MKRSPIRRKSWIKRGTKPLRKVNSARQEKRRKSYRVSLNAYKKSDCYKEVDARSGGRCEGVDRWVTAGMSFSSRCYAARVNNDRLTHHHLTYSRFGGAERPADIIVLCDRHNAEAEAKHPTRQRNYREERVSISV